MNRRATPFSATVSDPRGWQPSGRCRTTLTRSRNVFFAFPPAPARAYSSRNEVVPARTVLKLSICSLPELKLSFSRRTEGAGGFASRHS